MLIGVQLHIIYILWIVRIVTRGLGLLVWTYFRWEEWCCLWRVRLVRLGGLFLWQLFILLWHFWAYVYSVGMIVTFMIEFEGCTLFIGYSWTTFLQAYSWLSPSMPLKWSSYCSRSFIFINYIWLSLFKRWKKDDVIDHLKRMAVWKYPEDIFKIVLSEMFWISRGY